MVNKENWQKQFREDNKTFQTQIVAYLQNDKRQNSQSVGRGKTLNEDGRQHDTENRLTKFSRNDAD